MFSSSKAVTYSRVGDFVKGKKMNIYVGNLSRDTTDDDLRQAFEAFGQVTTINIIKDKFSGESRGFGFVEMPAKTEAEAAIEGMNGQDLKGNELNVNEAKPREDKAKRRWRRRTWRPRWWTRWWSWRLWRRRWRRRRPRRSQRRQPWWQRRRRWRRTKILKTESDINE